MTNARAAARVVSSDGRLREVVDEPAVESQETSTPPVPVAMDVRSTALSILAGSAVVGMLWWAQAVFIPLLLSILITHGLEPLVAWLEAHRCPRWLGVVVVVSGLVVGLSAGAYALREPATTFINQLPESARRLRVALEQHSHAGAGPIQSVQQIATELDRAAGAASRPVTPAGVMRVRIEEPPFRLADLAWRGSQGLFAFLAQTTLVVFLVYYLLIAGDLYRRKLASIAGPSLTRKRAVLHVLLDIDHQIQRFLLTRGLISIIVAGASWLLFVLLGLHQAGMWALVSGCLNVVPYVGPVAAIVGVSAATFAQTGAFSSTLLIGGAASLVAALEGYVLTPRLIGRAGRMNAVAIFVGVLFWGWLWGVWGMLLAVPLLTVTKAVCSEIEDLHPIAELLSE